MASKLTSVSLECKVWRVKSGVQSAQCRGQFKGPPSDTEWTFGSVGKFNAVSGKGAGRQVDVHAQHDNRARPRFHTVSSVKRAKLWGLTCSAKRKVRKPPKRTD